MGTIIAIVAVVAIIWLGIGIVRVTVEKPSDGWDWFCTFLMLDFLLELVGAILEDIDL